MEYVANINGRVTMSSGSLHSCNCGQLFWVGWDTCPNCKENIYQQYSENKKLAEEDDA